MCPFVGFNYRKCKKYTNNIAQGNLSAQGVKSQLLNKPGGPPRLEALTEGKKRGSRILATLAEEADVEDLSKRKKRPRKLSDAAQLLTAAVANIAAPGEGFIGDGGGVTKMGREEAKQTANLLADLEILPTPEPTGVSKKTGRPVYDRKSTEAFKHKVDSLMADMQNYAHSPKGLNLIAVGGGHVRFDQATKTIFRVMHEQLLSRHPSMEAHLDHKALLDQASGGDTNTDEIRAKLLDVISSQDEVGPRVVPDAPPDVKPKGGKKKRKKGKKSETRMSSHPDFGMGIGGSADNDDENHPSDDDFDAYLGGPSYGTEPEPKEVKTKADVAAEQKKKGKKGKKKKDKKRSTRSTHPSGFSQTGKTRTDTQLHAWLDSLSDHSKKLLFAGEERYGAEEKAKTKATQLYNSNNTSDIEAMRVYLEKHLKDAEGFEDKRRAFDTEMEENRRRLLATGLVTPDQIKQMKNDPKRLQTTATVYNKIQDKMFQTEVKNLKIGNSSVTQFLKKSTIKALTRSDFETMRMSEQMGLAQIQKYHQYGQRYGRYTTIMLALRDVIGVLLIMKFAPASAVSGTIKAWKTHFPHSVLDGFFWGWMQKSLPKRVREPRHGAPTHLRAAPQPSKDTKFWASQKMANVKRQDRIMRGYDTDRAGMHMPPDRAVLHTRTYPTTNKPWSKIRSKTWAARHKAAKGGIMSWDRSFLRR